MNKKLKILSVILAVTLLTPSGIYADSSSDAVQDTEQLETIEDIYCNSLPEDFDEDTDEYDGYLYRLSDDTSSAGIRRMERRIDSLDFSSDVETVIEDELYAADSLESIAEVADAGSIEYIEPNYIYRLEETSFELNDRYYQDQKWIYNLVGSEDTWASGMYGSYNGKTSTVAVLDTGVSSHPELTTLLKGRKFSGGKEVSYNGDISSHGTFVAGIIAASANNGVGIAGMMPETRILPIAVFKRSKGEVLATSVDIIKGIEAAIEAKADVINMSFGSTNSSKSEYETIKKAYDRNIILVAASGNDGADSFFYPASYSEVISVGAVDRWAGHAAFSNYNDDVWVSAPGTGIIGTVPLGLKTHETISDGYKMGSGTSFAAPYVTALAAMAKSIRPDISPSEFANLIKRTSRDIGSDGYDKYFGWGLISFANVYKALTECTDTHSYGEWNYSRTASFARDGTQISRCLDCNYFRTRTVYRIDKANPDSSTFTYDGSVHIPSVESFTDRKGRSVSIAEYGVTYENQESSSVGRYAYTVQLFGDYSGEKTFYYRIVPEGTGIVSLTPKSRGFAVTWEKQQTQTSGYQIRHSESSSMSRSKTITVKGRSNLSRTVSKLKSKQRYYVQVRTYKTVNGEKLCSSWSPKSSVRTRR